MKILVGVEETGGLRMVDLGLGGEGDIGNELMTTLGNEGRSSYVQKMHVFNTDARRYVAVARRGGVLQLYDAETLQQLKEWKPPAVFKGAVVGLEQFGTQIVMCSASGTVIARDIDTGQSCLVHLRGPISSFRLHKTQPGIAAVGGKDREVEILEIFPEFNTLQGPNRPEQGQDQEQEQEEQSPAVQIEQQPPTSDDFSVARVRARRLRESWANNGSRHGNSQQQQQQQQQHTQLLLGTAPRFQPATGRRIPPAPLPRSPSFEALNIFDDSSSSSDDGETPFSIRESQVFVPARRRLAGSVGAAGEGSRGGGGGGGGGGSAVHAEDYVRKSSYNKLWRAKDMSLNDASYPSSLWISDIQFLETGRDRRQGWKVAAATRYGEVRIYDTGQSKLPVSVVAVSNHPVINLWCRGDSTSSSGQDPLYYTDTQKQIGAMDLPGGTISHEYLSRFGGSNLHIDVVRSERRELMVTGGLDKTVRVLDTAQNCAITAMVKLQNKITEVAVLDSSEQQSSSRYMRGGGVKREASSSQLSTTSPSKSRRTA